MTMVTREAVFQAAQKIAEGGTRPSQVKVRELLGGGSYSDIGPHLRQWQQMQKASGAAPAMEMPEDAIMALNDFGTRLWAILSARSATMIEAARQGFDARCAEMEQEGSDLREAIASLEAENVEMAAKIAKLEQQRAPTDALLRELSQENGRLAAQLEAERATNNRLAGEVSDLRARLLRQEEEIAMLRGQVHDLTERQAGTQALWTATEARNEELVAKNNALHDRAERAEGRSDLAEARADRLRDELEGRTADNAALRDQIAASQTRHQEEVGRLKLQLNRLLAQQEIEGGQPATKTGTAPPQYGAAGSAADAGQRQ